jgi:hypothetical protein
LLIKKQDNFHEEKDAVFEAGLQRCPLCNKRMIHGPRPMDKIDIATLCAIRFTPATAACSSIALNW